MKIVCALGQYAYGNPQRGESYEYANFVPSLRAMGYEVVHFELWDKSCYRDFADLNRRFLSCIEREQPDFVLCVQIGYELWLESLQLARNGSNALFIHWATDDSWKYEEASRWLASGYDLYVTTYAEALRKAQRDGHRNFLLSQWGARSDRLLQPKGARECRYGVSFVGAAYGNRLRWVEHLRAHGIEVACFGHGWPAGPVPADQIPLIVQDSMLSLNFGDSGLHLRGGRLVRSRQIKARVFEVTGYGGCLLTEPADGLDRYFTPGVDVAVFEDEASLVEQVKRLTSDHALRDAMAQAGWARTCSEHVYSRRLSEVLAAARALPVRRTNAAGMDWATFEALACTYHSVTAWHFVASGLSKILALIFGARRGPRAARRLFYELYWRFAGERTYRAAGLPGRLFYRDS